MPKDWRRSYVHITTLFRDGDDELLAGRKIALWSCSNGVENVVVRKAE